MGSLYVKVSRKDTFKNGSVLGPLGGSVSFATN